jgi:hypothetical protein
MISPKNIVPAVLLCCTALLLSFSHQSEDDFIDWSATRKLRWEDFRGTPESGSDRAALSAIMINIDFSFSNNNFKWKITCRFNKKKSWGRTKTDYILSHEQAHFDITEAHARKLHQKLKIYSFNPKTYQKDLQAIYQQIVKEENEMQTQYDTETNHSINKDKQAEWLVKVSKLLVETKEFADYH